MVASRKYIKWEVEVKTNLKEVKMPPGGSGIVAIYEPLTKSQDVKQGKQLNCISAGV